jgi:hypothetical protein
LCSLFLFAFSIAIMPTNYFILEFSNGNKFYGQSALFWASLIFALLLHHRFQKYSKKYPLNHQPIPNKQCTLFKNPESRIVALLCGIALLLFFILPIMINSNALRFILFSVFTLFCGVFLALNSSGYQRVRSILFRKFHSVPRTSHIRRDNK